MAGIRASAMIRVTVLTAAPRVHELDRGQHRHGSSRPQRLGRLAAGRVGLGHGDLFLQGEPAGSGRLHLLSATGAKHVHGHRQIPGQPLPDRRVQRAAASKNDPGSRSAPPARGWPAIGRYQPGDQRRTSSGGNALPADSRGPAHGVPAAGTCPPEHLRSPPAPLVTTLIAISQRTRSQRPGSPAASSARPEHRPARADVGAAECPDLGGSNHGTESPGWAPD